MTEEQALEAARKILDALKRTDAHDTRVLRILLKWGASKQGLRMLRLAEYIQRREEEYSKSVMM